MCGGWAQGSQCASSSSLSSPGAFVLNLEASGPGLDFQRSVCLHILSLMNWLCPGALAELGTVQPEQ